MFQWSALCSSVIYYRDEMSSPFSWDVKPYHCMILHGHFNPCKLDHHGVLKCWVQITPLRDETFHYTALLQISENLNDENICPSLHKQVHDCNNRKSRPDVIINTHFTITMWDIYKTFLKKEQVKISCIIHHTRHS